jgi:hypothetical protein
MRRRPSNPGTSRQHHTTGLTLATGERMLSFGSTPRIVAE